MQFLREIEQKFAFNCIHGGALNLDCPHRFSAIFSAFVQNRGTLI